MTAATQKNAKEITMQAKLGHALLKSLLTVREQKGSIRIEDVGAIFEQMASSLHPANSTMDNFLRKEIEKMANYIGEAKKEIAALLPEESEVPHFSEASTQLGAVVKSTEQAAETIMDAADEIQLIVSSMGTGSDAEMRLNAVANRIYEACNFQDITGQRINKVMSTLDYIEGKILKLVTLFGNQNEDSTLAKAIAARNAKPGKRARADEHMMSGPTLSEKAPSQAEIDALFNNLKNA